jgi:hypothetical protein
VRALWRADTHSFTHSCARFGAHNFRFCTIFLSASCAQSNLRSNNKIRRENTLRPRAPSARLRAYLCMLADNPGALGVVVRQDAAHEDEGIGQASLLQRVLDRHGGVTGAEDCVADMRVRYRVIRRSRIGIRSDHFEAAGRSCARRTAWSGACWGQRRCNRRSRRRRYLRREYAPVTPSRKGLRETNQVEAGRTAPASARSAGANESAINFEAKMVPGIRRRESMEAQGVSLTKVIEKLPGAGYTISRYPLAVFSRTSFSRCFTAAASSGKDLVWDWAVMELANGAEGYIPPREQHDLGGYTTWPARTAGLEEAAELQVAFSIVKIMDRMQQADLEARIVTSTDYERAIRRSKPVARWELNGPDMSELDDVKNVQAEYERGYAHWLQGPQLKGGIASVQNRCVQFVGGRLKVG